MYVQALGHAACASRITSDVPFWLDIALKHALLQPLVFRMLAVACSFKVPALADHVIVDYVRVHIRVI